MKVEYRESIKKQVATAVGGFLLVCAIGWTLMPINTLEKLGVFVILTVGVSVFSLWAIKKYCRAAICNSCSADLFEVIDAASSSKFTFSYCPSCGARVEI